MSATETGAWHTPPIIEERDDVFDAIYNECIGSSSPPKAAPQSHPKTASRSHLPGKPSLSDNDVTSKVISTPHYNRLYSGNHSDYPSQSEADMALAGRVAFYAGGFQPQVDRIMQRSGLYRPKWDEPHYGDGRTYGQMTVERACQRTEFYDPFWQGNKDREYSGLPAGVEWEKVVPFTARSLPTFPVDALPEPLATFVREVATVKQVPVDMVAMLVLAVIATAGMGSCEVHVGGGGYKEPLSLYIVVFMEPGNRKSSTFEAVAAPVREAERDIAKRLEPEIAEASQKRAQEEKRLEHYRNQAAKEGRTTEREALEDEIEHLEKNLTQVPVLLRYMVEDVTMEKLACLVAEQGMTSIMSAEGGIFGLLAGRYVNSGGANIDIILKGHSGEDYRVDRVGRASVFIPKATITMGMTVQPDILRSMADSPEFRGRGLLGRFLYSLPESLVGTRFSQQGRSISPQAEQAYHHVVRAMLDLASAGTDDEPGARHPLLITGEAWEVWAEGADEVERRQADGEDLAGIRDWASKLAGAVARIAGGFHLVKHAGSGCPWAVPISAETVADAWQIGNYLISHALAVFGQMGADSNQALARKLLGWVERRGWLRNRQAADQALDDDQFTVYECFRAHQSTSKSNALMPALNILCERNYIRPEEGAKNPNGGRPKSQTFRVNPAIIG